MRLWDLSRYVLSSCVAVALLAGCSGSQPPISAPGAMPQRTSAGQASRDGAWMLPEAEGQNLIYLASGSAEILSYKSGKIMGTIDGTAYEGVCSDAAGNVFFVGANSSVVEYSHGGTVPIATLYLPGSAPSASGCASDPTTGNLAVTYYDFQSSGTTANVAVFAGALGSPSVYQTGIASQYCTYDGGGNLFVDGTLGNEAAIAELPNGGTAFTVFPINKEIGGNPSTIVWDGKYLSVEGIAHSTIRFSRVAVTGSTAMVMGTVHLRGKLTHGSAGWLLGNVLLVPYGANNVARIGFWLYPKGGKPTQVFTQKNFGQRLLVPRGLTVSVASPF